MCDLCLFPTLGTSGVSSGHPHTLHKPGFELSPLGRNAVTLPLAPEKALMDHYTEGTMSINFNLMAMPFLQRLPSVSDVIGWSLATTFFDIADILVEYQNDKSCNLI